MYKKWCTNYGKRRCMLENNKVKVLEKPFARQSLLLPSVVSYTEKES